MNPGKSASPAKNLFFRNVIVKGLVLFIICNLIYAVVNPIDHIGELSLYNSVFPGRKRLPFGERPDLAYNFTLNNLPTMISSHEIDKKEKSPNEFRTLIVGDSSVWGYLLPPEETLSSQINNANVRLDDGRVLYAYNLGYPTLSTTKDLFILDKILDYDPDLVIWMVTLESLVWRNQLNSPLLLNNREDVKSLIQEYNLPLKFEDNSTILETFLSKTIIGERRALADWFRLQIYGVLWTSTGIDQAYPENHELPQWDLSNEIDYYELSSFVFQKNDLAFPIIQEAVKRLGSANFILVNEPIFISGGQNSDIRYNNFYPKWVYDDYRKILREFCLESNWIYLDAWNLVPIEEFSNSAIHITKDGTQLLAQILIRTILENSTPKP